MDIKTLTLLKNNSTDTSLLYVEDSKALQKQASRLFGSIFDRFYQAHNGEAGLDVFKTEEPDIIITDIDMPNKNGIDMIKDMKAINPEVNVIVLSAHHDQETLFKTMNLGVANFIPKPLNTNLLAQSLLSNIEMIAKKQKIKCMSDLNIIKNHNVTLSFFNTYKGIPIQDSGTVTDLSDDSISFKVTSKQLAVMNNQGFTLVKLPEIKKYIKANISSIDIEKKEVTITDPRYINFKARDTASKRLKVDKSFKVTLDIEGNKVETYPYDASYMALGLVCEERSFEINTNDKINAHIEFQLPVLDKKGNLITKNNYKFNIKSKVLRMQNTPKGTILALQINLKDTDKPFYERYLKTLETNLVNEIKELISKF